MPHFLGMLGERWWRQFRTKTKIPKNVASIMWGGKISVGVFAPKLKCPKNVLNCVEWKYLGGRMLIISLCSHLLQSVHFHFFLQSLHFHKNPFNRPNWPQTGLWSFNIFNLKNIEISTKGQYIQISTKYQRSIYPNIYQVLKLNISKYLLVPKVNILSHSWEEGFLDATASPSS